MNRARYNPPQQMILRARFVLWSAALLWSAQVGLFPVAHAATTSPSDQPFTQAAATLAHQIAGLAGPGPAKLVIRNNSTLTTSEIPAIRQLLERDLRGYGVLAGSSDSATLIRITLSQNLQGGLWIAEVQEGTETRVAMLPVTLGAAADPTAAPTLTLRRTLLVTVPDTILDAATLSVPGEQRLILLEPDRIVVYARSTSALAAPGQPVPAWTESQSFPIPHDRSFPRDLRGRIVSAPEGSTSAHIFDAYLPGVLCNGSSAGGQLGVACSESDEPWPLTSQQKAFYSAMRNYFTGILTPGYGMELPPFYSAADIPRPTGVATLLNEVSGNVVLIDNATVKPIAGANDWGSDFAVVRSGCSSGAQVLVSGSGAATAGDSLRAFEISGREALPVSAPLTIDGAITAMSPAPDGASAIVIVEHNQPTRYEVWNVAALCN
jgi:hypothetical protein